VNLNKRNAGIGLMSLSGLLLPVLFCCGAAFAADLFAPENDTYESSMALLFCFILPLGLLTLGGLAGGGWLLRQSQQEGLQRAVLDLARANAGRVTATEVALHTSLKLEDAQHYLDGLARQGLCEMEYTENGVTCFVFKTSGVPR
jgi:uncharacterized RDD family membrane protein YckC